MAETSAAPTADDRSRYETLKKEIMQALPKKRAIDKSLVCSWKGLSTSPEVLTGNSFIQAITEVQIYNLEALYLTETAAHSGGNIIQGFENYLKNQSSGRRRYEVHDQDRVFSNSSLTYQKVRIPYIDISPVTHEYPSKSPWNSWGKGKSRQPQMKNLLNSLPLELPQ